MTIFHVVRHGPVEIPEDVLAGRKPGYHLQQAGRSRVEKLIPKLAREKIRQIYASPLERTQETAQILAGGLNLNVLTADELLEVDFGEWSGCKFPDLKQSELWSRYNTFRSATCSPGGELFLQTQARIVGFILRLREQAPDDTFVLVTHGDVVRAALTYFLGMPIDLLTRLEIGLASLSTIRIDSHGAVVLQANWTTE